MKVCFVTTSFPRWRGDGQGAFIWEAARAITQEGVQVRVIAMHSPGARTYENWDGVEIIRPRYWWPERWEILRKEGGGLPVIWQKYPIGRLQILPFMLIHTLTIARCAQYYDMIHAHWTLSAGAACLGRWMHHRPIMATLQGSDVFQIQRVLLGTWVTRQVLQRCECITVLSRALLEATVAIGVKTQQLHIIPNGVDTKWFVPPSSQYREDLMLYVGSLIERKGIKHLLTAMPEVFRLFPQYHLVLIGEGPQHVELRRWANALGIAERIVFLGAQPQEQVRTWMQKAKIFILPSIEEGQGVVLVEAMACGTPVIASRVGGISDVVTSDVGILVPPADPTALTEAICSVLSNQQKWAEMSHCARVRAVEHYDWQQIANRYISLYKSVIKSSLRTPLKPMTI